MPLLSGGGLRSSLGGCNAAGVLQLSERLAAVRRIGTPSVRGAG